MKISSGNYKYRNIEVPNGIRPTTEKVREAVFSMVRDWIPDAVVLDLFAGSGAMGLEALSRGAGRCYFNDINRQNYRILLSNIANCNAGELARTSNRDFESCIVSISEPLDVVILDPPYEKTEYYDRCFELLQDNELLNEGSVVIAEHLYDNKLLDSYGNLKKIKEKKYGTIGVDVYVLEPQLI
ncbi:MAG: 16S rRNA (guanine(966)-N(2))-methyltransferase RsmD [Clostridiales bacterium]|nr:16S rRNA (guanine(966)-N(2))-methyltransferase RsmD [Candidatus Crickella caballi]